MRTSVSLSNKGLIGSVFAPNAHFTGSGGAINGQGIFDSLSKEGVFEFHNFRFNWRRQLQTGRVEIVKYKEGSNITLAGATFTIKDTNGNIIGTFTTDENRRIIIENIPFGEYIITEITAPNDFLPQNENINIIINSESQEFVLRIDNEEILGSVQLLKVDEETQTPLDGGVFTITDSNNQIIDTKTTGVDGLVTFSNLSLDDYIIDEIQTPPGFDLMFRSFPVTIQDNQLITYTIDNQANVLGSIEVLKVNANGLGPLAGAVYEIRDSTNTLIETITTDDNDLARLENIPYGTYSLEEIIARPGFTPDLTIHFFTISRDIQKIFFTHKNGLLGPTEGSLELLKVDRETPSLNLAGATFNLTNLDTNQTTTLVTDSTGKASVGNLPFGNYKLE